MLPNKSDGFAAAAEGALLFLGAMGVALASGAIAMILAWRWRKSLSIKPTALAFALLPVTLAVLVLFFAYALTREGS